MHINLLPNRTANSWHSIRCLWFMKPFCDKAMPTLNHLLSMKARQVKVTQMPLPPILSSCYGFEASATLQQAAQFHHYYWTYIFKDFFHPQFSLRGDLSEPSTAAWLLLPTHPQHTHLEKLWLLLSFLLSLLCSLIKQFCLLSRQCRKSWSVLDRQIFCQRSD